VAGCGGKGAQGAMQGREGYRTEQSDGGYAHDRNGPCRSRSWPGHSGRSLRAQSKSLARVEPAEHGTLTYGEYGAGVRPWPMRCFSARHLAPDGNRAVDLLDGVEQKPLPVPNTGRPN